MSYVGCPLAPAMVLAKFGAFAPSVQNFSLSELRTIIYLDAMWWFRGSIGRQSCQFRAGTASIAYPLPGVRWDRFEFEAPIYWMPITIDSWDSRGAHCGLGGMGQEFVQIMRAVFGQFAYTNSCGYGLWPPDWHAIMKICECLGPDCIYCLSGLILSISFVRITKLLGPCDGGIRCCGSSLCCMFSTQTSKQFEDLAKIRKVGVMLPNKLVISANFVGRYLCEFYGHVSNVEIVLEISKCKPTLPFAKNAILPGI